MAVITGDTVTIISDEEYTFQKGGRFHVIVDLTAPQSTSVVMNQKLTGQPAFTTTLTFDKAYNDFWFTPNETYRFTFNSATKLYISRFTV